MNEKAFSVIVNNQKTRTVSVRKGEIMVDGKIFEADVSRISEKEFHIIRNNHSYNISIAAVNRKEKTITLLVNGTKYRAELKDRLDELLHSMGMDKAAAYKISEVKAPMPGLVLRVMAEAGAIVKKGDPLLVLEAMKMENILKSSADAVIKKVSVAKGDKVDKNQVLLEME
jgi:acetyl/propionyl-CoA carboxylase alpha subunit